MNKLDDKVKDYYQHQTLSPEATERMLKLGEKAAAQGNAGGRKLSVPARRGLLVFAASFLLAVIAGQFYHFNKSASELVLAEIAMNHNKHLESEYVFKDFRQLKLAMQRLDFELQPPENLPMKLLGGRYCSIQGNLAAQLKVTLNNVDEVATLYVTPVTERLNKISDQNVQFDNVSIRLWKDGNYFYGLASDAVLKLKADT